MRVAILGFGLIGGSIALALRRRPASEGWSVRAWSRSPDGPRDALAAGAVDLAPPTPEATIDGADLVVLAAPVPSAISLLDELAGSWRGDLGSAVVTDVGSTKRAIVRHAAELGLPFVGGHPMAGTDASGWDAARPDLFDGRPWVVVPAPQVTGESVTRVRELALACGATPLDLDASTHDRAVAAISHLPLVLSAALVEAVAGGDGAEAPDWSATRVLSASGWRDMTRLARGDVEMGAGILETNADEIAARLRDVRTVIDAWLGELGGADGPDGSKLAARLRAARRRLEAQ
ncbi:MAG: prephenate dehydrogenase [Chloroflexota bacterium]